MQSREKNTFAYMSLRVLIPIIVLLITSSCVEIIDDITINSDGSGTFRYNINLSSSKVKINSILALDSLDGKRVPSLNEIAQRIKEVTELLELKEGISNVVMHSDYDNFIFKLSFDFENVEVLQNGIKQVAIHENNNKEIPELDDPWLSFDGTHLVRSVPNITVEKVKSIKVEDRNLLKEGSYTSITRFNQLIDHAENAASVISKNNKAIMIRTTPYDLMEDPGLIDNSIYIQKQE